jgi:hypothetical protein
MMETAQTRARYHRRLGRRLPLDEPPIRRVLLEGIVNPVLVVQVINTTPILEKSEKSGTRGIRGSAAE